VDPEPRSGPPAVVVSDGQFPAGAVVFTTGSGGGTVIQAQQTAVVNGLAIVGMAPRQRDGEHAGCDGGERVDLDDRQRDSRAWSFRRST
jgi:hypothetical protein